MIWHHILHTGRDTKFRTFCPVCLGSGVLLRSCACSKIRGYGIRCTAQCTAMNLLYHLNSLNRDNYQFWVSLPYIFLENNFRVQVIAYICYLECHLRTFILPPNLTRDCCGWANPGDMLPFWLFPRSYRFEVDSLCHIWLRFASSDMNKESGLNLTPSHQITDQHHMMLRAQVGGDLFIMFSKINNLKTLV